MLAEIDYHIYKLWVVRFVGIEVLYHGVDTLLIHSPNHEQSVINNTLTQVYKCIEIEIQDRDVLHGYLLIWCKMIGCWYFLRVCPWTNR